MVLSLVEGVRVAEIDTLTTYDQRPSLSRQSIGYAVDYLFIEQSDLRNEA